MNTRNDSMIDLPFLERNGFMIGDMRATKMVGDAKIIFMSMRDMVVNTPKRRYVVESDEDIRLEELQAACAVCRVNVKWN